jgi:surface antigen
MFGWVRSVLLTLAVGAALSACVSHPLPPEISAYTVSDVPRYVEASPRQECVPYARQISGIQIYGDAVDWWNQAAGRYAREADPRTGSLLVLYGYAGPKNGHLALVTRIVSNREIRVDHANWLNDGNLYLNSPVIDVSPDNDWSMVRVFNNREGNMGVRNYPVRGFISSTRLAAR